MPSLKRSCIELFEERSAVFKIQYTLNKSDYFANYSDGSKIIFIGLDDSKSYQKLQSITNVDMVWIEELPEVQERVYENADLILRGGKGLYKQFIGTFNPVSTGSWVYKRWWENENEEVLKIKTRTEDNVFGDAEYLQTLKNLQFSNKSLYAVYYLGDWGSLKGVIYDNYDIVESAPSAVDETVYGLDFGFNNQTALLEIKIKDCEYWAKQQIYERGLTNTDLIVKLKNLKIDKNAPIYCDSAEPDRIEEIFRSGFNALPSNKDVFDGIDFVKSLKLHILSDSSDLVKEISGYVWKEDKEGRPLDEPVAFQNHLMDAMRYALYTHLKINDVNVRAI